MGWVVFSLIAYILLFILVPLSEHKALFPFGLVSVIILYLIDSTLIRLGAFSYSYGISRLSGLPILYLISGYAGGILLIYFSPSKETWKFYYILLSSAIFLILELIMHWVKYFHYHNWSTFNSYFLNIFGFSVVLSFSKFLGYPRK